MLILEHSSGGITK